MNLNNLKDRIEYVVNGGRVFRTGWAPGYHIEFSASKFRSGSGNEITNIHDFFINSDRWLPYEEPKDTPRGQVAGYIPGQSTSGDDWRYHGMCGWPKEKSEAEKKKEFLIKLLDTLHSGVNGWEAIGGCIFDTFELKKPKGFVCCKCEKEIGGYGYHTKDGKQICNPCFMGFV